MYIVCTFASEVAKAAAEVHNVAKATAEPLRSHATSQQKGEAPRGAPSTEEGDVRKVMAAAWSRLAAQPVLQGATSATPTVLHSALIEPAMHNMRNGSRNDT